MTSFWTSFCTLPNDTDGKLALTTSRIAMTADEWTPSELYWIIKNGLKFTSMPAWGPTRDDQKLWALTAFLESQGGTVDVTLNDIPATAGAAAAGGGAPAEVKLPGDPKAGELVFQGKGTCIACHKAGKIGASPVGPDLSQISKIQTPDYIMKKILDPKGMGTVAGFPPGVMPQDLGTRLAAKEYMDLVAFLLTLK
jgi:mono/diheme cytochrome c family protein